MYTYNVVNYACELALAAASRLPPCAGPHHYHMIRHNILWYSQGCGLWLLGCGVAALVRVYEIIVSRLESGYQCSKEKRIYVIIYIHIASHNFAVFLLNPSLCLVRR
jgi:hypothetical protein